MSDLWAQQRRVDDILRLGIIFSIVWVMGLGSLLAVIAGLRARRLIRKSGGQLVGTNRVRWCLIVGGLGLLWWLPGICIMLFQSYFGRGW
jgi:hypothetical protein